MWSHKPHSLLHTLHIQQQQATSWTIYLQDQCTRFTRAKQANSSQVSQPLWSHNTSSSPTSTRTTAFGSWRRQIRWLRTIMTNWWSCSLERDKQWTPSQNKQWTLFLIKKRQVMKAVLRQAMDAVLEPKEKDEQCTPSRNKRWVMNAVSKQKSTSNEHCPKR